MSASVLVTDKIRASRVSVDDSGLSIDLADGRSLTVPLDWFPRLRHGTVEERGDNQIIAAGRGIHWPRLDEDISVAALLDGQRSAESPASVAAWLRSRSKVD